MKQVIFYSLLILLLSCGIGRGGSEIESHQLQIMLTDKARPAAITADYASLGLTELKPSSRSQPLFTATVNLSDSDLAKLIDALKADDRVVSVNEAQQNSGNSSSTNTSHGTSRPKQ